MRSIRIGYADRDGGKYVVIAVRNSASYLPGQTVTRDEVQDLCDGRSWRVEMVALDVLSAVKKGGE